MLWWNGDTVKIYRNIWSVILKALLTANFINIYLARLHVSGSLVNTGICTNASSVPDRHKYTTYE